MKFGTHLRASSIVKGGILCLFFIRDSKTLPLQSDIVSMPAHFLIVPLFIRSMMKIVKISKNSSV